MTSVIFELLKAPSPMEVTALPSADAGTFTERDDPEYPTSSA